MNEIRILLLGKQEQWNNIPLAKNVVLDCLETFTQPPEDVRSYEAVILDRTPTPEECQLLHPLTKAHTLLASNQVDLNRCRYYFACKLGKIWSREQIVRFLKEDALWFFPSPYGEKYQMSQLTVSRNFHGQVSWMGNCALRLEGAFGSQFTQTASWKNNIPLEEGQTIDFWLEYRKSPGVSITLNAVLFVAGSLADVLQTWTFDEESLKEPVQMKARKKGFLFVSIHAKGTGTLEIIALHDRYSRGPYGYFIPGGERYVTSQREEIFCYFDPGDRKPPLNVYFSGYKTREGFEGYYMMRKLGSPFLLIAEARLEGGSFYIGSEEYEKLMVSILEKYRQQLRFSADEVILSGNSMGSTGALYYGCDLQPHAVIVGKPVVNLGTVALNEKRNRPGGFPTSLDLLLLYGGDTTIQAAQNLDQRFWEKFRNADWGKTKLILSYMLEDDYDREAYHEMLAELSMKDANIYGRGLHGRHNDNTYGIVQWFTSQFRKILREDFADSYSQLRQEITK